MTDLWAPPALRAAVLYRGLSFHPLCLGHLGAMQTLGSGQDLKTQLRLLAALLAGPPSETVPRLLGGKVTKAMRLREPRDGAERAALSEHVRSAWSTPGKWEDAADRRRVRAPHESDYASSEALRLALRIARISGVDLLLCGLGLTLPDLPVKDALALAITDDELHGAHYYAYDRERRAEERSRKAARDKQEGPKA